MLSLGSDGAPKELSAQEKVVESAREYLTYTNEDHSFFFNVPLLGNGRILIVMVQDPKHARARQRQISSSPELVSYCSVDYTLISNNLPPYYKTRTNPYTIVMSLTVTDTMMNELTVRSLQRPSKRLLNMKNVQDWLYISWFLERCAIFGSINRLYIVNASAQPGRLLSFLCIWKNYPTKRENQPNSLVSVSANGKSAQSFKISPTSATSLVGLILSHHRFHPLTPSMPCKHGTEAVEHIFCWMLSFHLTLLVLMPGK